MYIRTHAPGALGEPTGTAHGVLLGKPIIALRTGQEVRISVKDQGVPHEVTREATKGMKEVFRSLGPSNVALLHGIDVELHIIPYDKQVTDLPEFASLKGQRVSGRLYDLMRSTEPIQSGSIVRYAIGEEDVAYTRKRLPHFLAGFAVSNDSARVVAQLALTSLQKNVQQKAFQGRRQALLDWVGPEAGSSAEAYFASSTAAFFGHSRSVAAPDPLRFTREWLGKNDPQMHALLSDVYQRVT
jgi:hypothetical protein